MNKKLLLFKLSVLSILSMIIGISNLNAQALIGIKTIPSANFPTIKSAVDSLNAQGVGTGGVIFDVAAGHTETSLVSIAMTATGTIANPIIFRKDPLTSGANPLITAHVGTLLASSTTIIDVMWSFAGSDYVTIDGIDLQENALNTTPTTQMEVGYGFYKASATDGANNNTLQNCVITLNRNNVTAVASGPRANATGSVGIEVVNCLPSTVGTAVTVTAVSGASSNNKFYANTIQNVNFGILLSGFAAASPYTLADLNNDIGGTSTATGNNIVNFGGGIGAASQCGAIFINNQWSFNISYNTVNNNNGSGVNHPSSNRGIWLFASSVGASCNINFNKVTISGGSSTTTIDWCLDFEMAQSGANGNVININNNQFLNCNKTVASTAAFTTIWLNTAASTVNCNNNYIYGFTYTGTGTTQCILSQFAGIGTLNINNNTIDSTTLGGAAATGTHYNIGVTAAPATVANLNGNTVTRTYLNTTGTGTKTLYGMYITASTPTININDNLVDSITRNGTTGGTTIGIYQAGGSNGTTTVNVRRNTVRNLSITGTGTTSTMYGMQVSTGTIICDSNNISNLSCLKTTGVSALYGIYDISSPTVETFSNNRISNLTHAGTGIVYGIYTFTTTGTRLVTNNTVTGLTGNGGNVIGLLMTSSSPTITRNRIFNLRSNGATAGTVFGISLTSVGTAGFANIANNLIDSLNAPNYSGTADAIRGISSAITLANSNLRIYYNTIRLSAASTGANFFSSAVFFTGNATATTARLDLQNNILVNNSIPNGTGNAVALRSSTTAINNYATTSNNNLFYAGTPGAANLIYHNGTNGDSTITLFKNRLATFEQTSVTENPTFISLNGTSPDYLHLDLSTPTRCESGGANIAGFTTDADNVIRQGNAGYSGLGSAPDIGADEGDFTGVLMVLDSINVDQNTAAVPLNSTNQHVVAVRVHTSNSFNPLSISSLKLNTLGTTNVNDIQNAKVYFTGSSPVFAATNQFGATVAAPNGTFYVSGTRVLGTGVNYFWVTYDVKNTATPNNFIDVSVDSLVIGGSNSAPINGAPIGSRKILGPLAGNYNVGVGQTYSTITAAAADLGSLGVSGPVTFILKDALYNTASGEVFPIVFNNYVGASSINTVTVTPDVSIISRIEGASNIATFDLNGISNLTIDGRPGGTGTFVSGTNLIIANTNANGPAIRFINEASTNRILYTDLQSNNLTVTATAGAGVVNFGTTTGLNGNDNNIIRWCDIHEFTGGNPTIAVSSIGTGTTDLTNNDGNIIDSCNIYNFYHATNASAAIYVGANNGTWQINANRFYQTANRVQLGAGVTNRVLWITPNTASLTSASGFVINHNFIGGNASSGTGNYVITGTATHIFMAMDISVGLGTPTSIQNNTITNFIDSTSQTSSLAFGAINIANGNVNCGTIQGNLIGSRTTNGAITFVSTSTTTGGVICLRTGGGTNNTINFANNIVSGIDLYGTTATSTPEFFGMNLASGTNINVTNNLIGDTSLANSINVVTAGATSISTQRVSGIFANSSATAVHTITNNTIANITNNYAAAGTHSSSTRGIVLIPTAAGTYTISNNLIRNLSTSTRTTAGGANSAMVGIAVSQTSGTVVLSGNTIHTLTLRGTSTTAAVQNAGVFFSTPATGINRVERNHVHSLSITALNPTAFITGFDIAAGNGTIQNNMIRLGLDSAGNSIVTPCVFRGITKNSGSINIYFNSVYIGGSGVDINPINSFAFQRTGTGVDDVRNNIFVNARSNASTGGKHYQAFLINTTTITLNNNIYFGGGTGAVFGSLNNGTSDVLSYASGWIPSDVSSGAADPQFINPIGSAQTVDLHINASVATPVESNGALIATITDDFDGQTRTGLTPTDIGADAGNFITVDIFAPIIGSFVAGNTASTADRIISISISDSTGVPNTLGNEPKVYFKKSFAGTYSSSSAIRTSGTSKNGQWIFTISESAMGGLTVGDSVYFYIVAQDSSLNANLASLPAGAIGTSVNNITTPPANLLSYRIVPGLSGNVNVGIGQTYTSLTNVGGLFEAINTGSLNGNITATITSDLLENGTNGLNQINETGVGNYTVSIVPDGTTERLIVGNTSAGLIRLNGADRVKIDGRFGGSGRYLRIRNRALAGHAITFLNDAKLDTVSFCHVESVNNTVGTITFSTSNVVGGFGNDSNAITNCIIRDTLGSTLTSTIPNTAISSSGTAGLNNDNNFILNNEIYNFGFNAMNLNAAGMGNNWVINNNAIYQLRTVANVLNIIFVQGGVGHTINNNNIGGSAPDRSGSALSTSSASTAEGISAIRLVLGTGAATNVNGNTISNMGVTTITGGIANIIWVTAGSANIENNVLGGGVMPYDTIRNGYDNGIINIASSTGTVLVNNNVIGNITYYKAGGDRTSGITVSAGTHVISNNTIRNIKHNGTGTGYTFLGMGIFLSGGAGHTVTGNTISNISNTNTGATAFTSVGINNATTSATISRNRVYNVYAVGTGTGTNSPVISGIYNTGADVNIQNNQVALGDSTILESRVYGIHDAGTANINVTNNSVYINGTMSGGVNNSFGIYRVSTSTINAMNNIVYNKRITNGTGFSYGMGSVNAVTSANLNYNLMIVADTTNLVQLGGAPQSWSALNSLYTTTYNTNWATTTATVQAQTLFVDTFVGNLGIVTTSPNAWYANGKGERVAGLSGDYNNASGVRSVAINTGAVDIGSVEFTPSSLPPVAFADKVPATNDSTQFFFGSRMIAKAVWGSAGTLPSAVNVRYHSGVNPSNTNVGTTFMNAYWDMQATGGSAYSYNLTLMQDSAVHGTIGSTANLGIAQYTGTANNWNLFNPTLVNNVTGVMSANNANSFGIFTGTNSINNPLPVKLLSLQATAKGNDVLVTWSTASEISNKGFEVERSVDSKLFKFAGFVKGVGNSNKTQTYRLSDANVFELSNASVLYYRLKQVDFDGKYTYSSIVSVSNNAVLDNEVSVYPNPFANEFTITLNASNSGMASIDIMNVQGKVVSTKIVSVVAGLNNFPISENASLQAGVYFVRTTLNGEVKTMKLVKN